MRIVFLIILFTFSILLIIGIIRIGRELHRISALLEKGAAELEGYLTVILSEESPNQPMEEEPKFSPEMEEKSGVFHNGNQRPETAYKKDEPNRQGVQLTNEEKKMLWSKETRQLFDEIIGDIF